MYFLSFFFFEKKKRIQMLNKTLKYYSRLKGKRRFQTENKTSMEGVGGFETSIFIYQLNWN